MEIAFLIAVSLLEMCCIDCIKVSLVLQRSKANVAGVTHTPLK